jgi:UMF1 family MFS transporter
MGRKKVFLMAACYTGAIACACLAGFSPEMIVLGMGCFVLATFSFALSDGFYNAFLPDIVTPDRYDRVSARGYSLGYVGSVLLVILCLVLVFNAEALGMTAGQTTRIAFIITGLWWAGFGTFTFLRLRERKPSTPAKINTDALTAGFRELIRCTVELAKLPTLRLFLITFFFYDMGVQTVMNIATDFGADELHLETGTMIIALLIIQFIAIIGAYFFSWLSERHGNIVALQTAVIIWCGICSYAYFITTAVEFYTLGALVGLTMGGIQSTSRAAYSKLLPADHPANASFFSFYSVLDKIAVIVGTFIFGLTRDITHSMRSSIIFLITFFVIGLVLLTVVNWGKKMAPPLS